MLCSFKSNDFLYHEEETFEPSNNIIWFILFKVGSYEHSYEVFSYADKDMTHKKKKKKKKHKHHHKHHHKKHGFGFLKKKKKRKKFRKHHKHKMMKKFMMPMLIAYKLKFFTLIPIFVGKALFHLALLISKISWMWSSMCSFRVP